MSTAPNISKEKSSLLNWRRRCPPSPKGRCHPDYFLGCDEFINFAWSHRTPDLGRSLGKPIFRTLSDNEWEEARMYMLSNCDEIIPFIEKHKQTIRDKYGRKIRDNELEHWHAKMFGGWFENHDLFVVDECHKQGTLSIDGGIFKDKKGKWKRKHYKLTNTHAMNLKDKPNTLTDGQWKSLVKLWDSEAHQTLSKKNAISRSQQKTKHTMGRKNYSRCEAEMVCSRENGGNPPTDGDVFIKTHINKVSGKALDPFSQGYIAQLREQSGLDENGLDEDGNQHSISNEVYANVLPTKRHKRIRVQR
ncbi:hypothetical protein C5167_034472 [Papaver somniferum]|uniref:Uncharacterized protein n=1 Tax=Papaver somniferum TaxID=3469 RepID=A0A4Y7KH92_PAPSO|nr:hypothetical protein C5167_034472 [Papaver somniferum]